MKVKATQLAVSMLALMGQANAAGLAAKITLRDGATRMARIEGVGCTAAICSRVVIKGLADGNSVIEKRLNAIDAIEETTAGDALLVLKDGTKQRLWLIKDFRVLYLAKPGGGAEGLDLANVRSAEFLGNAK